MMKQKAQNRSGLHSFSRLSGARGRGDAAGLLAVLACASGVVFSTVVMAAGEAASSVTDAGSAVLDASLATQGYCDSVQGVADADGALLLAPQLFGSTGLVNGGSVLTGDSAVSTSTALRLTAGVRYDLVRLYRGILLKERARAECKRYQADATVRYWATSVFDVGEDAGQSAREDFVTRALPQAEALLRRQLEAFEQQQATQEEVYSTQVRLNALRSLKSSSAQKQAALRPIPVVAGQSLDLAQVWSMVDEAEHAANAVEEHSARIREAQAWTFDFRGGYDQTFTNQLKQVPAFGILQVSYNMGALFQGEANARAIDGAAADRAAGLSSLKFRVKELEQSLAKTEAAITQRLDEATWLEKDAHRRWQELQNAEGERAQNYADYLWFELIRHRAERIYLEERAAGLAKVLGRAFLRPETGLGRDVPVRVTEFGPAAAKRLSPIALERLVQTKGELQPAAQGRFLVNVPKMRAVATSGDSEEAILRFRYLGPTDEQSTLKSGASKQQLGLKLRAENGCNLVYAMWRFAPKPGIQVLVKRNPGMTMHAECENNGYTTVAATQIAAAPAVAADGSEHKLRALWQGNRLAVFADGVSVWEGELPQEAMSLAGPVGIRSDNVRFEGALQGHIN